MISKNFRGVSSLRHKQWNHRVRYDKCSTLRKFDFSFVESSIIKVETEISKTKKKIKKTKEKYLAPPKRCTRARGFPFIGPPFLNFLNFLCLQGLSWCVRCEHWKHDLFPCLFQPRRSGPPSTGPVCCYGSVCGMVEGSTASGPWCPSGRRHPLPIGGGWWRCR